MRTLVISSFWGEQRYLIRWVASERRKNDPDTGLSMSPNGTGIATITEPINPPNPLVRREVWKVRDRIHRLPSSVYLWEVAQIDVW